MLLRWSLWPQNKIDNNGCLGCITLFILSLVIYTFIRNNMPLQKAHAICKMVNVQNDAKVPHTGRTSSTWIGVYGILPLPMNPTRPTSNTQIILPVVLQCQIRSCLRGTGHKTDTKRIYGNYWCLTRVAEVTSDRVGRPFMGPVQK